MPSPCTSLATSAPLIDWCTCGPCGFMTSACPSLIFRLLLLWITELSHLSQVMTVWCIDHQIILMTGNIMGVANANMQGMWITQWQPHVEYSWWIKLSNELSLNMGIACELLTRWGHSTVNCFTIQQNCRLKHFTLACLTLNLSWQGCPQWACWPNCLLPSPNASVLGS